jgi:hypothetical protein
MKEKKKNKTGAILMRMSLLIITGCLALSVSCVSFAMSNWDPEFPGQKATGNHCSDCECTDKGYYYNSCMTKREYCETFGNIGQR